MTVHERFMVHMKPSTEKQKRNYKLYSAIRKYGRDKFFVETLEENIPISSLNEREIEYIAKYDSFKNGYNSSPGGDGRVLNKVNNEDELLRLAKSGIQASEIAARFNVNKATVFRTLHKLGFFYRVSQKEILDMADRGMSNKEIASILKCDLYTVSRALNRAGKRKHRVPTKLRNEFDLQSIVDDYNAQMPIDELCKKHNISKTTFYRIKGQNNFPSRPQIYKHKIRYKA